MHIDRATDVRVHVVKGELGFDELRATLDALYQAPDFRPEQAALWDLREADLTSFSTVEVALIAELVRQHRETIRAPKAALVVSRDADFGMARMFEIQVAGDSPGNVRVFRDLEKATSWVNETAHD